MRWHKHGDPLAGRIPQGDAMRFFRETVLAYDGEECFTWPYGRDSDGYARLWTGSKAENVCRLVCEEQDGPPSDPSLQAGHSCGNGHLACVAKRHLRWVTPLENAADRSAHGRHYRGGHRPKP